MRKQNYRNKAKEKTKYNSNISNDYLEYHVAGVVHPEIFRSVTRFAQLYRQTVLQYQSASLRCTRWFSAHLNISWMLCCCTQIDRSVSEFSIRCQMPQMHCTNWWFRLNWHVFLCVLSPDSCILHTHTHTNDICWLVYTFNYLDEKCDTRVLPRWFHCHYWNKGKEKTQILALSK